MSIVSKPFTFSAGATIIASQHNSDFDTLYNDYNGNIDNTNISLSAAIAYSKLNLSSSIKNSDINSSFPIVGSNVDLTSPGSIGSTSPGTGAFTTLKVGTTHQGDILYDNGTSIIRLTPGTSGQFLKTQGNSANPVWSSTSSLSNIIYQYLGSIEQQGSNKGEITAANYTTTANTGNYRYYQTVSAFNTFETIMLAKYVHLSGITTITIHGWIWQSSGSGSHLCYCKVDIGGQNATIQNSSGNIVSPEYRTNTITISGLTPGTVYDITVGISVDTGVTGYLGRLQLIAS